MVMRLLALMVSIANPDLTKYKNFKEAVLKNNGKLNLPLFMKPAKTAPPLALSKHFSSIFSSDENIQKWVQGAVEDAELKFADFWSE